MLHSALFLLCVLAREVLSFNVVKPTRKTAHCLYSSLQLMEADHSTKRNNRRNVLESLLTATVLSTTIFTPSISKAADGLDYKAVAEDIAALVVKTSDWGPTLVRLAWHSSGTYDKMLKNGGSGGGTIRFKEELAHGGNAGLADTAVSWMDPIYGKYKDQGLSYADLYTLGGGKYPF
jgi:catalase (peroxidase I)